VKCPTCDDPGHSICDIDARLAELGERVDRLEGPRRGLQIARYCEGCGLGTLLEVPEGLSGARIRWWCPDCMKLP
jgi:hypothetical protein